MLTDGNTLWAMDHVRLLAMCAGGGREKRPTASQISKAAAAQGKSLRAVKGKVAVLPFYGCVQQRMDYWGYYGGCAPTDEFGEVFDACVANAGIDAIVIDVDSPGGTIYGVQELSDKIFAARGSKPIIAVANSMCCSAAYWVASAADQLAVTPGGDVGSVGVYTMHVDYSKMLKEDGVEVTLVKAGKFKAECSPYLPLSDEARDHLQEGVDDCYMAFLKAVARNRGTTVKDVRDNYGGGRSLGAAAALEVKMVDRIATLSDVLTKLTGSSQSSGAKANADVLRLRHEHRKRLTDSLR
jgi:capsid assembly protease